MSETKTTAQKIFRILVVDDEKNMRYLIHKILKNAGYDCQVAVSGEDALKFMRNNPVDVVVTDIEMPEMDGIELTRSVKKEFDADVVAITGYTKKYSFDQIIEKGATDFIEKPIKSNELVVRIKRVLRERMVLADKTRSEKALMASENQLRALRVRLEEVEEDLKKELARELHDRIGQNLAALNINLNVIQNYLSSESLERTRDTLHDAMGLLMETASHVRDVMTRLRPVGLDEYGLVEAINWYGKKISDRTGMELEIHSEEYKSRLSSTVETALFRIVQEAFTNIAKHAQAKKITVTISEIDEGIHLVISDDGKGFDVNTLRIPGKDTGWGLVSMKERAHALQGECHVTSKPGHGTTISIDVKR